uniref:hypothetical protein n=1 Tax=Bifidobacterium longum TaxID=216816 RepID=UPI00359C7A60
MQLKKHNSKTPPKRKPKWLRKGIALLAAVATLATGGVMASTASAADIGWGGGGLVNSGNSGGGGALPSEFLLWLADDKTSTAAGNPPTGWNSGTYPNATADIDKLLTKQLAAAGIDMSGISRTQVQDACNQAVNSAIARANGKATKARVVGLAAPFMNSNWYGTNRDNWWDLFTKHWDAVKPVIKNYLGDWTDAEIEKFGRQLFSEQHDRMTPGSTTNSVVCIAVNETEPPMAFTPTISTEAPHIIQEGQPITDKVTVGVKSGDHWIDGTSVTAKGYYFTGSKDAIIRNLPYTGDPTDAGINNYLNQIRSAGGEYPWVTEMGARYGLNRAEPGPWVRDGDKNDSRAGRKRERRPAGRVRDRGEGEPLERRSTPLPIAGRTWACTRAGRLCSLFPLRGPGGSSPSPF